MEFRWWVQQARKFRGKPEHARRLHERLIGLSDHFHNELVIHGADTSELESALVETQYPSATRASIARQASLLCEIIHTGYAQPAGAVCRPGCALSLDQLL